LHRLLNTLSKHNDIPSHVNCAISSIYSAIYRSSYIILIYPIILYYITYYKLKSLIYNKNYYIVYRLLALFIFSIRP